MSRYFIILYCFLSCLTIHAQDNQQDINSIKKSKRYVYASATSTKSKEEAVQSAKELLLLEVEQWFKDEKKDGASGYIVKVKNNTSQIETQRGKLYRVFVYVAKKDILPYYEGEEVETVKAVPSMKSQATELKPQLTEAEERILKINKFDEIKPYVMELKEKGTCDSYGKYANMPQDADVYIFIYNQQGEVCAKIKKFGSESINMSTWQNDDVTNYKECGAIWIKMKE